jgi:hypothetical protein
MTSAARWPAPSRPDPSAEPSPQLTLLTEYRGTMIEAATTAGVERVRTSNPDDFDHGLEVVEGLEGVFTADDARAAGASPHVLGAVFRTLARRGAIVSVGTTTATTLTSHGRLTRQWRKAEP